MRFIVLTPLQMKLWPYWIKFPYSLSLSVSLSVSVCVCVCVSLPLSLSLSLLFFVVVFCFLNGVNFLYLLGTLQRPGIWNKRNSGLTALAGRSESSKTVHRDGVDCGIVQMGLVHRRLHKEWDFVSLCVWQCWMLKHLLLFLASLSVIDRLLVL